MNIGIDVDGVLTDIQEFNNKHAPPFFKRKFKHDVVDKSQYDVRDMFACSDNEYRAYWKRYLFWYVIFEPARKEIKYFIRNLRSDGHKIYIISKRVFTSQNNNMGRLMRFLMKNWLWRNKIKYDKVVFCDNDISDSKKSACFENEIDVMIDDESVNINAIATITKAICFDASYNQNCEGENIFRSKNFDEIYKTIIDFQ